MGYVYIEIIFGISPTENTSMNQVIMSVSSSSYLRPIRQSWRIWVWIALGEISRLEEEHIRNINHKPSAMPPSSISISSTSMIGHPILQNISHSISFKSDASWTTPDKPNNLTKWIECFNRGASIKLTGVEAEGYTYYTWQSAVVLPRSKLMPQHRKKYTSNHKSGVCDAPTVGDHSAYQGAMTLNLDKLFPKILALAGLKKDKYVPKGLISFTKCGYR